MPGVTVERLLWIIVTIVIAGVVLFGVIYPYIIGVSTIKEFTVTDIRAYTSKSSGSWSCNMYITVKNLGTIGITSISITISNSTDSVSLGSRSVSISSGGEGAVSITVTGQAGQDNGISPGRYIASITATFEDGSTVTHTYEILVKKKPS